MQRCVAVTAQRQAALDDYEIEGGKYSASQKQHAAQHPAGLLLTASVIGRLESRLEGRAPYPITVEKATTRFGAGQVGAFVADYNDFTQYFGEVLSAIGRLQDLLSAGAPDMPVAMTRRQKAALRPTSNRPEDAEKKAHYRNWKGQQAAYANVDGAVNSGAVFDVVGAARDFDEIRHKYWHATGDLQRAIDTGRRLGKNAPTYDALNLKFRDVKMLANPKAFVTGVIGKAVEARKNRVKYDKAMAEFAVLVGDASDEVKDKFEKVRDAEGAYWRQLLLYKEALYKRDSARIEARQRAATLGQALAPPGESRDSVLAEIRMPMQVADAWRALAVIGGPARESLVKALGGREVVEEMSRKAPNSWRSEVEEVRLAWQRAHSWDPVLTKDAVQGWQAVHELWAEVFRKFNV